MRLSARRVAFMGLMLALSIALSLLENWIPPIPSLPPGVRLGFSNILVMYALLYMTAADAFLIVLVKALFAALTRGATAGAMSLAGGLASAAVMLLLFVLFKKRISLVTLSLSGAVVHNVAQLVVAVFLMQSATVLYYLPILVLAGVLTGYLTGTLLRLVMPALARINKPRKGEDLVN